MTPCPRTGCKNEAQVHPTYGVLPCLEHQKADREGVQLRRPPEFYSQSKQDRIQRQRDIHGKDLIQPWINNKPNPEFAHAYPELVDNYFTPEQLKEID